MCVIPFFFLAFGDDVIYPVPSWPSVQHACRSLSVGALFTLLFFSQTPLPLVRLARRHHARPFFFILSLRRLFVVSLLVTALLLRTEEKMTRRYGSINLVDRRVLSDNRANKNESTRYSLTMTNVQNIIYIYIYIERVGSLFTKISKLFFVCIVLWPRKIQVGWKNEGEREEDIDKVMSFPF